MKTAESKTASPARQSPANKPFFGKGGDSFFETPVQAKLNIGKPNDPYEKEADSTADKVVQRMSAGNVKNDEEQKIQTKPENLSHTITPIVQQKCKHCEEEEQKEKKVDRKPIFESESEAPVQRKCKHCEEEEKKNQKEEQEDAGTIQRVTCRECEEGDKVLMKPMPGIQRSEEDQTPKNDGSRTSILAAAQGELGKVNARLDDGSGQRVGADRLAEYFKIAAPDVWDESIIRTAGAKMPSWCGIFSVWAHKKAGKDLGNWQMGKGVSAFNTLTQTDSPQPGDIGYIHEPNQHHAVVKEIQGDNVLTIDGNSGNNSEVKENTKPRSAYTGFMTAFGAGGEKSEVQKKDESSSSENATASTSVESRLTSSKGKGETLPEQTRQNMEQSFGADFNHVRVHTGSEASNLSNDLRAQAFTHGSDIYFNSGKFNPGSDSGKHLLAHELTHVIQQEGTKQPGVQKKDESTLCDPDGKNRPKSVPSASSVLTSKYTHLARVITGAQLEQIQKCLDAQFKISEHLEKQKPFKDKIYFDGKGGYGGASTDVAKFKSFETKIAAEQKIIATNKFLLVDSKLLAADDIKRPSIEDNEGLMAYHEQLYKRFTEKPVRITLDPCQVSDSVFNIFLKFEWEVADRVFWQLPHDKGLIRFSHLMTFQKLNLDYTKLLIGQQIKILEKMLELRREMGDTMMSVTGKKIGIIHRNVLWNRDVTIGAEIGKIGGYVNDARGRSAMYNDLMSAQNKTVSRVVLVNTTGWLHIFATDPNFDSLEMTSPDNDGYLYIMDKERSAGINIYENYFYTKESFELTPGSTWSGKGWRTPQILSDFEEFAIGAILGDAFESNSGDATFGQIVIGLIPIVGQIADARDVCVGIYKIYESGGKDGKVQTAFALIGFVPLFGDWIKRAAKVGKNAPDAVKAAAKTDAVLYGDRKSVV